MNLWCLQSLAFSNSSFAPLFNTFESSSYTFSSDLFTYLNSLSISFTTLFLDNLDNTFNSSTNSSISSPKLDKTYKNDDADTISFINFLFTFKLLI